MMRFKSEEIWETGDPAKTHNNPDMSATIDLLTYIESRTGERSKRLCAGMVREGIHNDTQIHKLISDKFISTVSEKKCTVHIERS